MFHERSLSGKVAPSPDTGRSPLSQEKIPFFDFGGDGPLLHFAHANGYTPACFQRMIKPMLSRYRVIGVCHRPLWPGSRPEEFDDWQIIADDMVRFFDQEGLRGVVGMGHSLGAVVTMYAAHLRPELFSSLVLIDPVFLPPPFLQMAAANPSAIKDFPLVKQTLRRRNHWPSRQAAFEHFRKKPVFRRWSDAALMDYVNYGLAENDRGEVTLKYPREWEVRFYTLPPMAAWEKIPAITQPTLAIRGAESDTLLPQAWQLWQELQPQATFIEMEQVGHMLLMEQPERLAEHILGFLQELETE